MSRCRKMGGGSEGGRARDPRVLCRVENTAAGDRAVSPPAAQADFASFFRGGGLRTQNQRPARSSSGTDCAPEATRISLQRSTPRQSERAEIMMGTVFSQASEAKKTAKRHRCLHKSHPNERSILRKRRKSACGFSERTPTNKLDEPTRRASTDSPTGRWCARPPREHWYLHKSIDRLGCPGWT